MPNNLDWLFNEQGRMRADLPPLLDPYGHGRPHMPKPKSEMEALADLLAPEIDLGSGWTVEPERWPNPDGTPWNGLLFNYEFPVGRR